MQEWLYSVNENHLSQKNPKHQKTSLFTHSTVVLFYFITFHLYRFHSAFSCIKTSYLRMLTKLPQARSQRGGRGEISPALFQKLEKSALILGKNALIIVIYGLNLSFKMQFLRVFRRKIRICFPTETFFLMLYMRLFIKVP